MNPGLPFSFFLFLFWYPCPCFLGCRDVHALMLQEIIATRKRLATLARERLLVRVQ